MTWYQRKGSKYSNVKQTYKGYSYMSKKEAQYAWELDQLVKVGEVLSWEKQKRISIDVNGHHICNYYIDFVVYHKGGLIEYVEIKGFETDVWKLKWKLFEAFYGDNAQYKLSVIK